MDFSLQFDLPKADFSVEHGEGILFIGSCFSDEIATKAKFAGLNVSSNPFGTIFHPSLIARFISESIDYKNTERLLTRDDLYLSWDANSTVYAFTDNNLKEKLSLLRTDFISQLISAKALFITFGTAWVYRLVSDNQLVANCHKVASDQFQKELSTVDELVHEWGGVLKQLKSLNPNLKVVFTVSPVRHSKDGLIENNQSKAILIETIRRLKVTTNCSYFPSYEIMIDELRDYRFFKQDRVHPSEEAVDYIWRRFESTYFSIQTIELNSKVSQLRRSFLHRSIHEDSIENRTRKESLDSKIACFLNLNKKVTW